MNTKQIKKTLMTKTKVDDGLIPVNQLLSTGSTLLNLASTGRYSGGFVKGKFHYIVGDSASGKTALSLTCLAEATINSWFDDYLLIHDDVEHRGMFNIVKLFGAKLGKRLKVLHSRSVEEMYYNVDNYLKKDKPFIYVVDSMDSLVTDEAEEKFQEQKKAFAKGKQSAGSYGVSKAKANSTNLGRLMTPLAETGSILIILSQTRDNIGFGFEKKTRSGGRSLRFYASLEMWSSVREKIKKSVKGKPRTIGIKSKIDIKKNSFIGQEHSITVPIYYATGFDDLASCIDYLIEEGHWKKVAGKIVAKEFVFKGTQDALIQYIERKDKQKELRMIVGKVWKGIQSQCRVERKNKYL